MEKGERWWPVACRVAKAIYEADPNHMHSLTAMVSILRRADRAEEAMKALVATGDRFRDHRGVLYEWSTVAGAIGDYGLNAWLGGRALADGEESLEGVQCKLILAGLGVAFREMFASSQRKAFAVAQVACGHLGLQLQESDPTAKRYFERHAAEGGRHGVSEISLEQALEAIRKAVILGADETEPDNDPVFFERLLGDPAGYTYKALLGTFRTSKQT